MDGALAFGQRDPVADRGHGRRLSGADVVRKMKRLHVFFCVIHAVRSLVAESLTHLAPIVALRSGGACCGEREEDEAAAQCSLEHRQGQKRPSGPRKLAAEGERRARRAQGEMFSSPHTMSLLQKAVHCSTVQGPTRPT